jgi:tRNA(Ile)-lysidine synthase
MITFTYPFPMEPVILAISGGVDSIVLLDLIVRKLPKEHIIVAHYNHGLRGTESDADMQFVRLQATVYGVRFEGKKGDVRVYAEEKKMSIEAAARSLRYEFLLQIAATYRSRRIITAHHLDDRIETMIFNLLRGSKLSGIHALKESRSLSEEIELVRPLLHVSKKEIKEYAEEHSLAYCTDSSNQENTFLRNHIRNRILPECERVNPEYRAALDGFIEYTETLQDWINHKVEKFLSEKSEFSVQIFQEEDSFFQKEIVRYLYEKMNQGSI